MARTLSCDLVVSHKPILRLKMPSGYKVPAHNHPTDEGATVISGNFHIGMGDKLDEKKAIELTAGGYSQLFDSGQGPKALLIAMHRCSKE
jgi:uncharacterized RmlC-like cupin family protein